jgi:acyl-CoA thioester hydrolase
MSERAAFDLPAPHVIEVTVGAADIDAYSHVNNAVYVTWCDRIAWDHSAALGLPLSRCLQLDRGMAVIRTLISYLRPAVLGDVVRIATWIVPPAGKLRVRRRFQIQRTADDATLARAEIEYACIELSSGRPARWPPEFRERYVPLPTVAAASAELAPSIGHGGSHIPGCKVLRKPHGNDDRL